METKHTKGEWVYGLVHRKKNSRIEVTIPNHSPMVVYTLDKEDDCDVKTCGCISSEWANAKLIAAAPMLLEALIELVNGVNPQDACYGKFAHFWPAGSEEYIRESKKAYVGSKGIPTDEQILKAINAIKKATE